MKRLAALPVLALIIAGCQDTPSPTDIEPGSPDFVINHGATGGNEDFFFKPPMVPNPSGHPNFGDRPFNPNVGPVVEICQLMAADPITADTPCADPQPAGFPVVFTTTSGPGSETIRVDQDDEHYIVNWHTNEFNLSDDRFYRIAVHVGMTPLGFADVDVVNSGRGLKNVNTGEFVALKDGRTLPISFRIEEGALCENPALCASATIDVTQGGSVSLEDDQGTTLAVVTVAPTMAAGETQTTTITVQACLTPGGDLSSLVDIPLFGDCVEITADPPLDLDQPANASLCRAPGAATNAGLSPAEVEQLAILRARATNETFEVVALAHGEGDCPVQVGVNQLERILRFARNALVNVRDRMLALVQPDAVLAAICDRGCGGFTNFESSFQVGRPSEMNYGPDSPSDGDFGAQADGAMLTAQVLVRDAAGNPVEGATVSAVVTSEPGSVSPASVMTGADGIAEFTFTVEVGVNVLEVSGKCIGTDGVFAPAIEDGANAPPVLCQTGTLEFTATVAEGEPEARGKIVVNNDEWTLSNAGFNNAPDAGQFALNVASWFVGEGPGNFLVYSTNFGLVQNSLANTMTGAGHTWTVSTAVNFTLPNLLQYDAIFLAGDAADNQVLIDYVNAGGNVYLAGGTGIGGAVAEAARWNTFLNEFGLEFDPEADYNFITTVVEIESGHPIFADVTGLYQDRGSNINDLNDPGSTILVAEEVGGLYAVYEEQEPEP